MTKGLFATAAAVLVSGAVFAAAEEGNCVSKAKSCTMKVATSDAAAGNTSFVTKLEWDEEKGTYSTNYVYYFKSALYRGHAYTVWLEGENADLMELDIEPAEAESPAEAIEEKTPEPAPEQKKSPAAA